MAGSACYNIVYMSERGSTSNTYRVTGGEQRKKQNNSLVIQRRRHSSHSDPEQSERFINLSSGPFVWSVICTS